jgi:hypothetical protein
MIPEQYAVVAGNGYGRISVFRDQRREAETDDYRIGTRDLDAPVELINAWGQNEIKAEK